MDKPRNLTRQIKVLSINISYKCFAHSHNYYYYQCFDCKSGLASNIFSGGLSILQHNDAKKFSRVSSDT